MIEALAILSAALFAAWMFAEYRVAQWQRLHRDKCREVVSLWDRLHPTARANGVRVAGRVEKTV